ncbi:Hypothetical protein A7982_11060 [Minicystis rosea]|nr:Hypothetical protein A7982_11060 [Minicystis rosea]
MVPGRPRRRSLIQAASAAALGALLPARSAAARELDAEEIRRLGRGELVRVPLDVELSKGEYFGGVSYAVLPDSPPDVMRALLDPAAWTSILPLTLEARLLGTKGQDLQVFFKQGARLGTASYVLLVRRESPGLLRFWLDPSQPHEIADCWGYFRVQPWSRRASLLTYGALVHLDFGMVKMLFTEKIRSYALTTPALVRNYLKAQRARAGTPHD